MANCTKFREAQERHAKKSHPKCRRRGTSPRIPKTGGPKTQYAILRQVVTLIPPQIVHDIDRDVRHRYKGFSVWSHIVALIYQQLTRTGSLNGVCDAARVHESEWGQLRDATVPHRNTLSNANRKRDPALAEKLYWELLKHFSETFPDFSKVKYEGYLARFRERHIHLLDSSTIQLVLNSIDWARHRRKKAAAKLHMNLDLGSKMPSFAIVESAAHHDSVRAAEVTANLSDGDILVADRAYTDFGFLCELALRGVFFVVRQKRNMKMGIVERRTVVGTEADKRDEVEVLKDETVRPKRRSAAAKYAADDGLLRRVTAKVVVQGKWKKMVFFTNNFDWTPRTIAELYKARWAVELFFKEFKQTCQVRDFIGYNERAVKWQVWIGLVVHLLLRFVKFGSKWELSFSRLAGVVRCAVWVHRELFAVLALMGRKRGTAGVGKTTDQSPRPLISQGFLDFPQQNLGQQAA